MPKTDHPVQASIWMVGTIVSFTAMAVAGRELSAQLDTFELMFYRSAIGFIIVITVAYLTGSLNQVSPRLIHIHLIRNLCHFAGQNLWFYALAIIPLTQVFALEFTSPIWAMFLAFLILGERLTVLRLFVAACGLLGVMIITRPWGIVPGPGIYAAALAALGFGATFVFTRLLTRSQTVTNILFWLTLTQVFFGAIATLWDGHITLPASDNFGWLLLVAIGGLVAHFCLTKALSLAPAAVVAPVDFTRLPVIAIIGLLLYSEPLEWAVLIGATIIFAANYFNILWESRK